MADVGSKKAVAVAPTATQLASASVPPTLAARLQCMPRPTHLPVAQRLKVAPRDLLRPTTLYATHWG